jgi:hypothetical protein
MPVHEKDGCPYLRILLILALGMIGLGQLASLLLRQQRARWDNTVCKNQLAELANAVKRYQSDVLDWPMEVEHNDWSGTTEGASWITLLLGKSGNEYATHVNYLYGFPLSQKSANGKWSQGIDSESDPNKPRILDPWGNFFRMQVDGNGDGSLSNPQGDLSIQSACIAWSAGPDGDFATWENNIRSW